MSRLPKASGWNERLHLHAPDVDRADPPRLQRLHGGDRFGFALVPMPDAFGIDRPGPWIDRAADRIPLATLHHGDGVEQPVRHTGAAFGLQDGSPAQRRRRRYAGSSRNGPGLRQRAEDRRGSQEDPAEDNGPLHAARM